MCETGFPQRVVMVAWKRHSLSSLHAILNIIKHLLHVCLDGPRAALIRVVFPLIPLGLLGRGGLLGVRRLRLVRRHLAVYQLLLLPRVHGELWLGSLRWWLETGARPNTGVLYCVCLVQDQENRPLLSDQTYQAFYIWKLSCIASLNLNIESIWTFFLTW